MIKIISKRKYNDLVQENKTLRSPRLNAVKLKVTIWELRSFGFTLCDPNHYCNEDHLHKLFPESGVVIKIPVKVINTGIEWKEFWKILDRAFQLKIEGSLF